MPFLNSQHANPSSLSREGKAVRKALDVAREQVAALIDASPEEIIFGSGGTEAIQSVLHSCALNNSKTLLYGATEHSAVMEGVRSLSKTTPELKSLQIPVEISGRVDLKVYEELLAEHQPGSVHVMWVNNETGVIAPMADMVKLAHRQGALYHADAVQALGKIPLSVKKTPVDFLSLSAHKIYGPKGVGALFVSKRIGFSPWISGSQESNRRGGTENVAGIVGFGKACELAAADLTAKRMDELSELRNQLEMLIHLELFDVEVKGKKARRVGNTSMMTFSGVVGAELMLLLEDKGVIVSTGSACQASSSKPSHVLLAMGCSEAEAKSAIRFSLSRDTTQADIYHCAHQVISCVNRLRALQGNSLVSLN